MSSYFPWYDFMTDGFHSDYFAAANTGTSMAVVLILAPGIVPLSFAVTPGTTSYLSFPRYSRGGPVAVSADRPVLLSQRVVYKQSFSEVAAWPSSTLSTDLYFPWYDWKTPGFLSDYFYVGNPGGSAANVAITLPGASPLQFTVGPGGTAYKSFPRGTIGGPVRVSSDQPILASQRVLFGSSFSEIPASPLTSAGTRLVFPWYDWKTAAFKSDYFYIANPGPTTANVTISLNGATSLHLSVASGRATYRSFPHGTIGGPVKVTSDQPVLASQRVLYDTSFTETGAKLAATSATSLHFPWYYWAGSDMRSDYFYVANAGGTHAVVNISVPGRSPIGVTVAPGTTGYLTFPYGTQGGPVTISSDQPVLVSQRTLFRSSFLEFGAPPEP